MLDRSSVATLVQDLDRELVSRPGRVTVDLSAVESFDSAGLGGVVEGMRRARGQGIDVKLRGLSQPMLDFFSLVSVDRLIAAEASSTRKGMDPISRVGAFVEPMLDALQAVCATAREVAHELVFGPLRKHPLRLDRTAIEIEHCAVGALPIVGLIAFLLGLILAMQAYVQLRVWGAEIYMADMVGVAVMSEIGPLMTAIVLAARSGSSNAAQLGAMVTGEEIAALEQMGIRTQSFLVVPKVVACAFAAVALWVVFDVVAMCGGALFARVAAGIAFDEFGAQLQQALSVSDFAVAAAKSLTFGAGVGIVGCALGLRVQGGSDSVGRATTNSVVLGVFLVIVIDTAFVTAQRLLWP